MIKREDKSYYPGHIDKTIKYLLDKGKVFDYIFHVVDIRIYKISYLQFLEKKYKNKIIYIYNKIDLIDKIDKDLKKQKNSFFISCKKRKGIKKLKDFIYSESRKKLGLYVAITGVPNSGKSTLLNTLINKKKAKVGNVPGITISITKYKLSDMIFIEDLPGILPKKVDKDLFWKLAITSSIKVFEKDLQEVYLNSINYFKENNIIDDDFIKQLENKWQYGNINDFYRKYIAEFSKGNILKIIL